MNIFYENIQCQWTMTDGWKWDVPMLIYLHTKYLWLQGETKIIDYDKRWILWPNKMPFVMLQYCAFIYKWWNDNNNQGLQLNSWITNALGCNKIEPHHYTMATSIMFEFKIKANQSKFIWISKTVNLKKIYEGLGILSSKGKVHWNNSSPNYI